MKWISIKDKLPKQKVDDIDCSIDVFCYFQNGDIEKGCWYYKDSCWIGYNEWSNNNVTHWMPLPKPPKNG